jgi:hypothetical protein
MYILQHRAECQIPRPRSLRSSQGSLPDARDKHVTFDTHIQAWGFASAVCKILVARTYVGEGAVFPHNERDTPGTAHCGRLAYSRLHTGRFACSCGLLTALKTRCMHAFTAFNVLPTIAWIFKRHESRGPRPMHPKRAAEPHMRAAPLSSTISRQAQDIISSGLPIPNARIFDHGNSQHENLSIHHL